MTLANELTWRDWLAGMALSGDAGGFPEDRARRAYKVADAMIDASKLCTKCYDRPRFDSHLCESCEKERDRIQAKENAKLFSGAG